MLVENPKQILVDFDLDPCALGFDGSELWVLPRAARAIQSELPVVSAIPKPDQI